jgi:hypothetical protein
LGSYDEYFVRGNDVSMKNEHFHTIMDVF